MVHTSSLIMRYILVSHSIFPLNLDEEGIANSRDFQWIVGSLYFENSVKITVGETLRAGDFSRR